MNIELSAEAQEFGRQSRRAFGAAGGDLLVQQAERDPQRRETLVGPVLRQLGALELAPREDAADLEAAAALCRSAGYWAVPYPVAERLARPTDIESDGLVVVAGPRPSAAVAGLNMHWAAVTLDGHRSNALALAPDGAARETSFATELELRHVDEHGAKDAALGLVLPCWTLLGMMDRAIDLARAHVVAREQFGRPLATFQSVQFQLTDAEVERSGADVLARYALWSLDAGNDDALEDALALRLAVLEAAEVVFRVAHQLHGAQGFCDEAPLSWLSRYSQPARRLPLGLSATRQELSRRLGRRGLSGLFGGPLPGIPPEGIAL